jgi:hypothetical protein
MFKKGLSELLESPPPLWQTLFCQYSASFSISRYRISNRRSMPPPW